MPHPTARTAAEMNRNLAVVRERIARAAARSERAAEDVRLMVVTKTVPEDRIRLAVAAGCRDLGENKVQEARQKSIALSNLDVTWSIIGHLQTNKAKTVVGFAHEFQALDSVRVADALDRHLQTAGRALDVYVQVNTSGEDSKYGVTPDGLPALLCDLAHHHSLRVRGLMTLATFTSDTATVRSCFRLLRTLRDRERDRVTRAAVALRHVAIEDLGVFDPGGPESSRSRPVIARSAPAPGVLSLTRMGRPRRRVGS